jgi:hypothetical protein
MSPVNKTEAPPAKGSGGLLGRLFGRGEHETPGLMLIREQAPGAHSNSVIFRGSSSAATGCRWFGISC